MARQQETENPNILGEGNTPLINRDNIFFKLEFKNPSGSVKDRAMALQVTHAKASGYRLVTLSSSGNAGISAALYCQQLGLKLTVFVSPKTLPAKLKRLQELKVKIEFSLRPVHDSSLFANKYHAYNLRQSLDPFAVEGYRKIAVEIHWAVGEADAIFVPVSSGTIAVGIDCGYNKFGKRPAMHIVQTTKIYPLASNYDMEFQKTENSLADAIVARYTPRSDEVKKLIDQSKGWGWVISDPQMRETSEWLKSQDLACSYEGAATLAAYRKSLKNGFSYKKPVCILTGKDYEK